MLVHTQTVNDIGVAVDVGSTSIGVCCVDLRHNTEILSFSFGNLQCRYGADVITRMKHCIENRELMKEMKAFVEDALHAKLKEYLLTDYLKIRRIVYCGNTTMLHFLRGLSVDGLACAPFEPVDIDYCDNALYSYLPCCSAFIGADILAGAWSLNMGRKQTYDLLIDLGTNGELLLLNKDCGYATSTACGPVFDHVIKGAKYGSDCIRIIANCVKRGLIDKNGTLADAVFESGIVVDHDFVVKQEHVRNFQLAKGAIYAGIGCLIEKAQIALDDIDKVYISGGLGFHMNVRDAILLKMLPEELRDKIIISGNTSLEGAKKCLTALVEEENEMPGARKTFLDSLYAIRNRTECFELANMKEFQARYMKALEL